MTQQITWKWDVRFINLAKHIAMWSKDPSSKVGAVIADCKRLVSVGFNGFPQYIKDSGERLNNRDTRLRYTLHAEDNAFHFANENTLGFTLYTWPFPPCSRCANIIIQKGICRVVAPNNIPERWREDMQESAAKFDEANIERVYFEIDEESLCG